MDAHASSSPTLSRRQALAFGGLGVSLAAVTAACGNDGSAADVIPQSGEQVSVQTLPAVAVDDAVLLRTAASVEASIAEAYRALLDSGEVDGELADTLDQLRRHHAEHVNALGEAVEEAGGEPSDESNPRVQSQIVEPSLRLIEEGGYDADDVARLTNGLERLGAATGQSYVTLVSEPGYRQRLMEVSAADARYGTLLASFVEGSTVIPTEAVQEAAADAGETTTTGAPGTGARLPVAWVPSAFASLAPIDVQIGDVVFTWQTPGPNSYVY